MKIKASKLNSCILGMYLLLCLVLFMMPQTLYKAIVHLALFLISLGAFALSQIKRHRGCRVKKSFYEVYLIGVLYIISILLLKEQTGAHMLYLIAAPLFAVFVYSSRFELRILYLFFGLIASYFLLSILGGRSLDQLLDSSRNFISVIMMTSSTVLTVIAYRQTGRIIIWPSVVTTLLSILAIGRGGILFSSCMLLGVIYSANVKVFSNHKLIAYLLLGVVVIVVLLNFNSISGIFESLSVFERLQSRGLHDYWREHLMEEYLGHMDVGTILFGYDYSTNPEFNFLDNNPHNSFIRLHSYTGIMAFPLLICAVVVLCRFLKHNLLYFFLFISLLGRSYTDIIWFFMCYDFVFFLFILLGTQNTANRQMNDSLSFAHRKKELSASSSGDRMANE